MPNLRDRQEQVHRGGEREATDGQEKTVDAMGLALNRDEEI
jgi:hypothetical protein